MRYKKIRMEIVHGLFYPSMMYGYKMRKGDKICCKKDYCWPDGHYRFYSGHVYIMEYIMVDLGVDIIDNDGNAMGFYFNKNKYNQYIWDYFYTEQELRKFKLNRLQKYKIG